MKYGDRHHYENGHDASSRFSLRQLNEIRKATISRLICDNMDIDYLPTNPWFTLSKSNPKISCKSIPTVNLDVFKV
jgi:peroxidase